MNPLAGVIYVIVVPAAGVICSTYAKSPALDGADRLTNQLFVYGFEVITRTYSFSGTVCGVLFVRK
jgi:hypothetical protein